MKTPRAWRLLPQGVVPEADGPANMATDRALLEAVRDGAPPTLRLYRWDPPTLSFGRNQPAAGLYDEAAARDRRIAFVRRPTGGQAVLHADELTYAVIASVEVIGRPRDAYRRINEALVAGLRRLGVAAEVAGVPAALAVDPSGHPPRAPSRSPDWTAACFRDPAEGEVVAAGRKLVGSAQRCEGKVILQHGSILISGSQAPAEELLLAGPARGVDGAEPAGPGWTTLEEQLGKRPSLAALTDSVVAGFENVLGTPLARGALLAAECRRAEELRETFASRGWTWRR